MNNFRLIRLVVLSLILFSVIISFNFGKQASSHGLDPEIQTGRMSVEVVTERLVGFEGYSKITSIDIQEDTYTVKGIKAGREVTVEVNSLTGSMRGNTENVFLPLVQ